MMKNFVLFILLFITSIYCYAAGEVGLNATGGPAILVYNNGNGIVDLMTNLGFAEGRHYDLWNNSLSNDFNSLVNRQYQLVLTGSGGNYGTLSSQMQADRETWLNNSGKVVLSGQSADVNNLEYGANVLMYNMIAWALQDTTFGRLNFIALADNSSLWNWTPWLNSATTGRGTATLSSGSSVNIAPYSSHDINAGDGAWLPLENGDLSNWGSNSYDAYFSTLPQGFNTVAVTGAGQALTIVNTAVITPTIPEPASLLLLAFGIFLGMRRFSKKS